MTEDERRMWAIDRAIQLMAHQPYRYDDVFELADRLERFACNGLERPSDLADAMDAIHRIDPADVNFVMARAGGAASS